MSINTTLIYARNTDLLSYFDDWVDAFRSHPSFVTTFINVCDDSMKDADNISQAINEAEVIILHHSMTGDTLKYLQPLVSILQDRRALLVAFVGNEVNLPILGMAPKIRILQNLHTDIIATQLLQEAGDWLYADCTAKVISLPHGLNQHQFQLTKELDKRSIDLGTRSARYGAFIGDNERNAILEFFQENAVRYNLNVDLGLTPGSIQRFNRTEWCTFLNQTKATLSTEAGSFYLEKNDAIIKRMMEDTAEKRRRYVLPENGLFINAYRKIFNSSFKSVVRKLIGRYIVESHKLLDEVNFDNIKTEYFNDNNRCPVYSKAISSRHFDAIGTRTLHVMYPGRYNDILVPGEHYFELYRDHSNVDELLELLQDHAQIHKITNTAHELVMDKHTHKHRLDTLAEHIAMVANK